ncbi:MFS transporter [Parabacteroides sp. An277]|uniref:MFS transporter n=1 Tax=Parabacteroides sp. An277 TaxID=1965619 RepID=UPI000B3887C1|nr:MFS transporter [Parabacteroides sp. An277]OUO53925.1 MFS transporter [Parabacteroides sp. An277]
MINKVFNKIKGHPHLTDGTAYAILFTIGTCHLLNDMIQSVIPAIYPLLKEKFGFTFAQIGIITLVFQLTSSVLQPFVGRYADRHPQPYSLAMGMCFTLVGLVSLAFASGFLVLLLSVALIGCGSSVFHPEASRVAQIASGGKKSLAQSIFQVGGNGGSAFGPLLAALIVIPHGQHAVGWFALAALLASLLLTRIGYWYSLVLNEIKEHHRKRIFAPCALPEKTIRMALGILVLMIFSKYFFNACMTSYFTFYLIEKFDLSVQASQYCLFAYLAAFAIGTLLGGFLGDRYGRKYVILFSILGAAPFTLAMPYLNLGWTIVMAILTGLIIASAFSAIVVYATDLKPDKVGMIAGIFFGLMFGLGGIGSAFFGWLADRTSVEYIFHVSTWLPLLGIVAVFLPDVRPKKL